MKWFYKLVPRVDGYRVKLAPLGLRRIESCLLSSGIFDRDDVIIVHPDDLEEVVDRSTKVIGIGVKDPLGLGYVSLTYSTLVGLGPPMNRIEFLRLLAKVRKLREKYGVRVVLGDPGAWQITKFFNPRELGIDVVVEGEGESVAVPIFAKLVRGEPVEPVVRAPCARIDEIPTIRGATIYGAVEITRGCGRGCRFCSPTMQLRRDFPLEHVLKDIEVNLLEGQDRVLLVTEDLFLYGAKVPWEPNPDAVRRLLTKILEMRRYGLRYLQVTHVNLAVVLANRELSKWVAEVLQSSTWYKLRGKPVATVEVGIETGSPRLIAMHMAGKARPFKPEAWPTVVINALSSVEEYD